MHLHGSKLHVDQITEWNHKLNGQSDERWVVIGESELATTTLWRRRWYCVSVTGTYVTTLKHSEEPRKRKVVGSIVRELVGDVLQVLRKLRGDGLEDGLGEIYTILEFEGGWARNARRTTTECLGFH